MGTQEGEIMAKIFENCVFEQAPKFFRVFGIIVEQKTGATPCYDRKAPCSFLKYRE